MDLPNLLKALKASLASLIPEGRGKRLGALRQGWAKAVDRTRIMYLIASLHDLRPGIGETVDETTWRDLDMDEVFARLDRTRSMPGRQWLYHLLRTYEADPRALAERSRQHAILRSDSALREEAQLILGALETSGASWLAQLLYAPLPPTPRFAPAFFLCALATLGCLVGMFFFPVLFLGALALIYVNIVINGTYGRTITPFLPGLSQTGRLLEVTLALGNLPNAQGLPQVSQCREAAPLAIRIQRRLLLLTVDRSRQGADLNSFTALLNMLVLLDVLVFLAALPCLRRHQAELVAMLEAAASLDAAIAVASFQDEVSCSTTPRFVEGRRLQVKGLMHPLLAHPVGNDLTLTDHSALITGSNMAGKTTFMRTVGVNLLLARTLHFCLAEDALLPMAVVHTSIRRQDSLEEGKSYYFTELERLLEFVRAAETGPHRLFLIDEIFRGTNTLERLAASTAVLRHLGRNHIVLATTHDLELLGLLPEAFEMFHFSEQVRDGACHFDYRIQAGPARTRNALRLLELAGYPEPLTQEARDLADRIAAGLQGRTLERAEHNSFTGCSGIPAGHQLL